MHLPVPSKATIVVRFCPVLFELRKVPRVISGGKFFTSIICVDVVYLCQWGKRIVPLLYCSFIVEDKENNNTDDQQEWQKYQTMFK